MLMLMRASPGGAYQGSRRGDVCDVTSGATYSLLGVFFFLSIYLSFFLSIFFFIPRVISAVTHPIFVIFLPNTCHDSGFQTQASDFKYLTYFLYRMQKIAQKRLFSRFFRWLTSRLRPLRKNGLS